MATVAAIEACFSTLLSGDLSIIPVLEDAIREGATDAAKGVTYMLIERKAHTFRGVTHPAVVERGQYAVITAGVSIRLVGTSNRYGATPGAPMITSHDRTFEIGDTCEESSYNLVYLGTITGISAKKIAIAKGRGERKAMQDVATFAGRNADFDLTAAKRRNAEFMD